MWHRLLLCAVGIVTHAYLDRTHALDVIQRWKPQSVGGHLVSPAGAAQYARARILLERPDSGAFASVDDEDSLHVFVVQHRRQRTPLSRAEVILHAVLWHSPHATRTRRFRDFCEWHRATFPKSVLLGDGLADLQDLANWLNAQ